MTKIANTTADRFQECIDLCWTARTECQKTFFSHCLEMGGKHVESNHVRVLTDCIAICQLTADSLVRESPVYAALAAACAAICEACAESCDAIETETMRQVGAHCRAAAHACHTLAVGGEGDETVSLPPTTPSVEHDYAEAAAKH